MQSYCRVNFSGAKIVISATAYSEFTNKITAFLSLKFTIPTDNSTSSDFLPHMQDGMFLFHDVIKPYKPILLKH